mmetsp:Transcript_23730/g.35407  ORF Transcript_23730/g.35407 Transcript_23730/m.35407 type:complete len:469 (-) Transcript_23730:64-1470(-)
MMSRGWASRNVSIYSSISGSVSTQASSATVIASLSMSCPMTTSSVRRSPHGFCQRAGISSSDGTTPLLIAASQGEPNETPNFWPARDAVPCCQWLCWLASQTRPFDRITRSAAFRPASITEDEGMAPSAFFSSSPEETSPLLAPTMSIRVSISPVSSSNLLTWNGRRLRKVTEEMPYSAVSGVCSPTRASLSQSGCCSATPRSNRLVPSNFCGSTRPHADSMSCAVGLNRPRIARSRPLSSSSKRSILFIIMMLANSSWSHSSCDTVRSSSSETSQPLLRRSSITCSSSGKVAPSTTVTSESSLATSPRLVPLPSRKVKVSATGSGSEIPLLSTTTWSSSSPCAASWANSMNRSSRRVQHTQPLLRLTIFSSDSTASFSRSASTFNSAMSFTMTAMRRPSRLCNRCFSKVVLPAPRKPERTVTGRGDPAGRVWAADRTASRGSCCGGVVVVPDRRCVTCEVCNATLAS